MGRAWGNLWTGVTGSTCKTGASTAGRARRVSCQRLCPRRAREPGPQEAERGLPVSQAWAWTLTQVPSAALFWSSPDGRGKGAEGAHAPTWESARERGAASIWPLTRPELCGWLRGHPALLPPQAPASSPIRCQGQGWTWCPTASCLRAAHPTLETWLHVSPLPPGELWVFRALPCRTSWWPLGVLGGTESSPSEGPQGGLSPPVRRGFRAFLPKTAGARPHSHRTMAWNSCLDHAWAPRSASSVPDDVSRSQTPAAWPGGSLWGHHPSMESACTRCDSRSPGREDIREPTV